MRKRWFWIATLIVPPALGAVVGPVAGPPEVVTGAASSPPQAATIALMKGSERPITVPRLTNWRRVARP